MAKPAKNDRTVRFMSDPRLPNDLFRPAPEQQSRRQSTFAGERIRHDEPSERKRARLLLSHSVEPKQHPYVNVTKHSDSNRQPDRHKTPTQALQSR